MSVFDLFFALSWSFMSIRFLEAFSHQGPPTESLFSFLTLKDVSQLRKSCKTMHDFANFYFPEQEVERLATRILDEDRLPDFSLVTFPESCKRNRRFVVYAVRRDWHNIFYANDVLKRDPVVIRTALAALKIQRSSDIAQLLAYIPDDLRSLPDFQALLGADLQCVEKKTWVKTGLAVLVCFGKPWCEDKDIVFVATRADRRLLWLASPSLRRDTEFISSVVGQNGLALEYVPYKLKADLKIVREAVQNDGQALSFASPVMKNTLEIVLASVRQSGCALVYASSALQANEDVVLTAVRNFGLALQYASVALRASPKVVLAAVCQNGLALQYASAGLKEDAEIVRAAVENCGCALAFADVSLKADFDIVLAAVTRDGNALQFASSALRENDEIVLKAVKNNGGALRYAASSLRENLNIVLSAVFQKGRALQYASHALRANRTVVLAAVLQGGLTAIQYASESLKEDPEIIRVASTRVADTCGARQKMPPIT